MRTFKIKKDYYVSKENIFAKTSITINPGITVLVGCNGAGKTTLLQIMYDALQKDENVSVTLFDTRDYLNGSATLASHALFNNEISLAATAMCSSEGEKINMCIGRYAAKIGKTINVAGDKELWFLFDAIDSGLSINNIIELKDFIKNVILKDKPDAHFIISANSYELARNERCFDVHKCEERNFTDYEDYRNFIIASGKAKEKR